jgi:hypothetical protein
MPPPNLKPLFISVVISSRFNQAICILIKPFIFCINSHVLILKKISIQLGFLSVTTLSEKTKLHEKWSTFNVKLLKGQTIH